jgi:hypothetical protein
MYGYVFLYWLYKLYVTFFSSYRLLVRENISYARGGLRLDWWTANLHHLTPGSEVDSRNKQTFFYWYYMDFDQTFPDGNTERLVI